MTVKELKNALNFIDPTGRHDNDELVVEDINGNVLSLKDLELNYRENTSALIADEMINVE